VLPEQESAELYDRWTVPSPAKPLFAAALANFAPQSPAKVNTANKNRGPLLLTAGGHDHTVPAAITTSTRKLYHKSPAITDFIEFPDRGHSLTIDHGWREVPITRCRQEYGRERRRAGRWGWPLPAR
jgi:pimeloyl-ACP methyl ester carboxylesterase